MSSVFMRTLSPAVPFRIFAYFNYRNSSSIHFSPHSYLSLCLLPNLFFSAIPLPTIMFTLTLISRPLPHSITLFSFPMFTAYPLLARFDHPLSFPYLHPHSSTTPFYYSLFHNSLPFPIFTLISATFRFLRATPICLCPCHLPSRGYANPLARVWHDTAGYLAGAGCTRFFYYTLFTHAEMISKLVFVFDDFFQPRTLKMRLCFSINGPTFLGASDVKKAGNNFWSIITNLIHVW